MINNISKKEKAIFLRKQGKTYSEILSVVPVAKSTLSIWLQSVNLSKKQKQRVSKKKLDGAKKGAEARRKQRIDKQNKIFLEARSDISSISNRELFIIGVILYWAEGSKEKEYHPGSQLRFANSDYNMIKLFLDWLKEIGVVKERISFDIYLHDSNKYRVQEVVKYWSANTGFSEKYFRVYFKKNIINTKRRNIYPDTYFGVARIYVKESSDLVRKISGWVDGVVNCLK